MAFKRSAVRSRLSPPLFKGLISSEVKPLISIYDQRKDFSMYCSKCGVHIKGEPKFCPNCGEELGLPESNDGKTGKSASQKDKAPSPGSPSVKGKDPSTGRKRTNGKADGAPLREDLPWRYEPVEDAQSHSLLYKVMAALTGALLFTAVVLVILAWHATGGF